MPTAPAPSPPASRAPAWAVLALALAALLATSGVLANDWCLDDVPVVQHGEALARGLSGVPRLVRRADWPGALEEQPWRPLALVSLALDHPGGQALPTKVRPHVAHAVHMLLHALSSMLLLGLVRRLAPGRPALAWGTALVFAVHPLAVPALTLATGRSAVLGVVLGLLTLRAALAWRPDRPALLPVVALCGFLALLTCEALAGLAFAALALDALDQRAAPLAVLRRRWPVYLALLLATALWALLWPGPGRPPLPVPPPDLPERLALGAEAVSRGVLKVLAPVGLLPERTGEAQAESGYALQGARAVAVGVGALLCALALLVPARRGGAGLLRAAVLLTGLVLVPAALTLPHGAAIEDRWAYVALPALALLAGGLTQALWALGPAPGTVGLVLALGALGILAQRQARHYRDDERVLEALRASPDGYGQAQIRRAEALLERAAADVAQAYRMRPHTPEFRALEASAQAARTRAGELLTLAGRTTAGRADARVWLGLGQLDLYGPTPSLALEKALLARRLDPLLSPAAGSEARTARRREDPRALRQAARVQAAVGLAHQIQGHVGLAADAYREAAAFEREAARRTGRPGNSVLLQRAALALIADGAFGEALPMLTDLALTAEDPVVRADVQERLPKLRQEASELLERLVTEARAHLESGQHFKPAVEAYEQALRVDARHGESRYQAAWLRGKHFGSYEVAIGYVDEGLALLARDPSAPGAAAERAKLEQLRADLLRWRAADEEQTRREEAEDAARGAAPGGGR